MFPSFFAAPSELLACERGNRCDERIAENKTAGSGLGTTNLHDFFMSKNSV